MIATVLALLLSPAHARPTDGGMFGFDPQDEVVWWDEPHGRVRVHFAIAGPSVTLLDDLDGDGVPDFPQRIAESVELAWLLYEHTGFRGPLRESDLGLPPLGGSDALDVYLVDFGGSADGAFRIDACDGSTCAGHLLIENDFAGYGYPSLDAAVATLTSHELFHGVQYAYTTELPVWVSEGTATWAQRLFDPDNADFLRYAQAYLDDAGRSLDKPPIGPVPAFAYATALWFDFLALRHGDDAIVALLESLEGASDTSDRAVVAIGDLLRDRGDAWEEAWPTFVAYNTATGPLAGAAESYPYAARFRRGPTFAADSSLVDETRRFFALASTTFRIDHAGGPLRVAVDTCDTGLVVALHPTDAEGRLLPALHTFDVGDGILVTDQPAGHYIIAVSLPTPFAASRRVAFCAGAERWCTVQPNCDDAEAPEDPLVNACLGCRSSSGPVWGWAALLGVALMRRRRQP